MTAHSEFQSLCDRYAACYIAKDAAGCAAVFALDAELFSPFAPPAMGRDAIKALHAEWVAEEDEDKVISVVSAGMSGDIGWCLARYSAGAESGTSLNVLQRQSDGGWRITHCSLNA